VHDDSDKNEADDNVQGDDNGQGEDNGLHKGELKNNGRCSGGEGFISIDTVQSGKSTNGISVWALAMEPTVATAEPASDLLLLFGLATLPFLRRKRRKLSRYEIVRIRTEWHSLNGC